MIVITLFVLLLTIKNKNLKPLKKITAILMICFFAFTNAKAQSKPASANEILNEAKSEAAKTHKNIFIIFHASWCIWCHRMDTAMNDPEIKTFFDNNYVIRHLTVDESKDKKSLENPGASALRAQYHGDEQGIPFWLIFDKDEKLLADSRIVDANGITGNNVGCPSEPQEVNYLIQVLKRTSLLTEKDLQLIHKRFSKIKE